MKHATRYLLALVMACFIGFAGCEWDMSDDADTWDSSMAWANFSGVYAGAGISVTVSNGVVVPTSGGLAEVNDEVVGVGNGVDTQFSGTLDGKPLFPGSLTITDGTESFEDDDEDGILTGSSGGTGAINYDTGVFSVTFLLQPSGSTDVSATYIYYVGEDGPVDDDDDDTTTSKKISRLTVTQEGNILTMIDDDGDIYRGKMGKVSTTGGDDTGSTSGHVIANFEVVGENNGLTFVGSFDGTYTAPNTEDAELNGTMIDRYLRGTWYNGSGEVGNVDLAGKGD